MSELKDTLINISEEIRTKIIPENIKAGVNIFNVEGDYEGESASSNVIKVEGNTLVINEANVEGSVLQL